MRLLRMALVVLSAVAVANVGAGGTAAAPPQPVPQVSYGRIERLADFPSRYVKPRHVDVWLPPDYDPARRYRVVYMHDGQMLFDARTTWNKQAWAIDAAMSRLRENDGIDDVIVVGVWNNGVYRHAEYSPQKFLLYLPRKVKDEYVAKVLKGRPLADNYLKFLVRELKPSIDRRYSTRKEAAATFVMGSSMGGLISIYALSEYPKVFGGAGCISTHWIATHEHNADFPLAAYRYLRDRLPAAGAHKLYFDLGNRELDALYPPYQPFVDAIVRSKGYTDADALSRIFDGAGHNETDWAQRVDIPLRFLLAQGKTL